MYEEPDQLLYKAQPFPDGGIEVTCTWVDAQKLADRMHGPAPARGPRVERPLEERSETDIERARQRAKQTIRYHIKSIGADHLTTFTTRQTRNTPEELWVMFRRFVRMYRLLGKDEFPYVAVPERHPTNPNHWHLHVATRGFLKLKIARQIWWAVCGGRGLGNVDVQYIRVRDGTWKAEKIARYVSKYVTKALVSAERFNKKRFSTGGGIEIPPAQRGWCKTRDLMMAIPELCDRFCLDPFELVKKASVFIFPGGGGFWFSVPPSSVSPTVWRPPPF